MCVARYSQRTTTINQPTNRVQNELARPIYVIRAQESIFWVKFGPFWAKNPNFYGKLCGNFGTHLTEKSPRHLFHRQGIKNA